MALIKCPECGKEISNKSIHCIHCGVPIKTTINSDNLNIVRIGQTDYDLTIVIEHLNRKEKIKAIKILMELTGINLEDAKELIENLESSGRYTTEVIHHQGCAVHKGNSSNNNIVEKGRLILSIIIIVFLIFVFTSDIGRFLLGGLWYLFFDR